MLQAGRRRYPGRCGTGQGVRARWDDRGSRVVARPERGRAGHCSRALLLRVLAVPIGLVGALCQVRGCAASSGVRGLLLHLGSLGYGTAVCGIAALPVQ